MMFSDKLEICPKCREPLAQSDYDYQACPCGWGPFGVDHTKGEGNDG